MSRFCLCHPWRCWVLSLGSRQVCHEQNSLSCASFCIRGWRSPTLLWKLQPVTEHSGLPGAWLLQPTSFLYCQIFLPSSPMEWLRLPRTSTPLWGFFCSILHPFPGVRATSGEYIDFCFQSRFHSTYISQVVPLNKPVAVLIHLSNCFLEDSKWQLSFSVSSSTLSSITTPLIFTTLWSFLHWTWYQWNYTLYSLL